MKKMKLSILTIFALIIASSIFYSCSKEEVAIETKQNVFEDISKMGKDDVFIDLVRENITVINQISDIKKARELTSKSSSLSNEELNELSISLGFSNFREYQVFYEAQNENLLILNEKYNLEAYDDSTIQNLALENFNDDSLYKSNNCERIRRNCIIGAGAILGHLGCATLDVTIVAGIVCHGAVLVIQAVVSDTCNAEAEDCEAQA